MTDNITNDTSGILPGYKPVLERLKTAAEQIDSVLIRDGKRGNDISQLTALCRKNHIKYTFVSAAALDRIYDGNHQGIIAKVFETGFIEEKELFEMAEDAHLPLIIALDQVQDPGNVGTLARSLYAIGGAGLLLPKHNSAFLGAAAAKASAGALAKLPVARATNLAHALDTAEEMGFTIYGAQMGAAGESIFTAELHTPAVLVLGNEDKGIRPGVAKRIAHSLHIPMQHGFDSVNVAQAGAMMMSMFLRNHIANTLS